TNDLDFSPSTSRSGPSASTHPVPSSSDDGTTLDWSGIGSEDDRSERRWTMSMSKRKDRDKRPSSSVIETRESMHAAKIRQIRTTVSPFALEKASTAREQLGRRYNLMYASLPSGTLNIAKVARWFGSQEAVVQTSLEQAEPFTWVKHLEKAHSTTRRVPWSLSALIMEEYVHQKRGNSKPPTHEKVGSINSSPSFSLSARSQYPASPISSSYFSLGPSISRKVSSEGRISFGPLAEPGRRRISMDRESRKSGESGYSSIPSGSSVPHGPLVSPTNSHSHLIPSRVGSDNGSSHNSLSEYSDDGGRRKPTVSLRAPLSRDILSGSTIKASVQAISADLTHPLSPIPDDPKQQTEPENLERPSSTTDKSSVDVPQTARNFGQRQVRISLPAGDGFRLQMEQKRQQDADEEQANREYELKSQLLDATTLQNSRVRLLLNHIAAGIREFDKAQSSLANSLNIPYKGIPRNLMDAFSHDPAAVTGPTRKYRSWRAVDDIHNRLALQRETFREFLSHTPDIDCSKGSGSVLADPIAALVQSLKTLDAERREIAWKATEVSDILKTVQTVHGEVKSAYNGTLTHTSVIYPEISNIVALEESYKDQYQHFWELGMDALTFFLDTVTPFWRTYGKTIGDDVQHFLIIPLYRNEFTGESKRYTIDKFPRRSLRHWIGLLLFFLGSLVVTSLQGRAAASSTYHFWLSWIPYPYIRRMILPFFWVGIVIQWWAVLVEFSVALTQLAVVVWWVGWYINIFT
ncbi:hypothetical protein B0H10DRAFT_1790560, partial [Mycena sp. CBHHK59/15]